MPVPTNFIFPDWPAPAHIKAATTTRRAGNLAFHIDDNPVIVQANQKKLIESLELPTTPVWLNQIHSSQIISLNHSLDSIPTADAVYCNIPDRVCAILTADCLPILVTDTRGYEVAAIHAGWRGLVAGIINHTFPLFKASPNDLLVWFGPAIGPRAFEVGADVRQAFLNRHIDYQKAFTPHKERWLGNIYQLATLNFNHLGIKRMYGGQFCTYFDHELFYSYRREKGRTGRMVTVIWINS